MAALLGSKVVAFDSDEACIAQLYHDAKEKNLPILPLLMDFRFPSPGYGLCDKGGLPATVRFQCDLVLALALVHHVVFEGHFNFELIAKGLSDFSRRWLLVEFVPKEDRFVSQWWSPRYSWYTLDNFMKELTHQFRSVRIYSSHPAPRVLLLCEK